MCPTIPGKIVSFINVEGLDLRRGKVDFGGIRKEVCLEYTPEARLGDYVLVHVGFALSVIDEQEARHVFEALRNTPGRKVLLTSDYHTFRAWRAFRKAGLNVQPRPFPDAGKRFNDWRQRWPIFLQLAGETGKILYYRARGWI